MMFDPALRYVKIGDAMSQLGNVVTVNEERALELERTTMVCSRFQARAAMLIEA